MRKTKVYPTDIEETLQTVEEPNLFEHSDNPAENIELVRIIELTFKPNSTDTVILSCDEGWQISFRIHNASSKVEPSLKFDINLIGQPQTLYSHHLPWE